MSSFKRYLLTGATGFIGGRVLESLLADGHEVKCLVRPTSNVAFLEENNAPYSRGEATDTNWLAEQTADVDAVIHIAGATAERSYEDFLKGNRDFTANLADACLTHANPPRFLFMSSMAASGPPLPDHDVRTEADEPTPVSHYGRSKLAAEEALRERADRLSIGVIRPSIVFGREDRSSFAIFDIIRKSGVHVAPGWFPQPVSLVHVDDLVQLVDLAVGSKEKLSPDSAQRGRGVWFAVDDSAHITYAEFGRKIMQAMNVRGMVLPMGRPIMTAIAAVNETIQRLRGQPAFIGFDKVRESFVAWKCSGQQARRDLGMVFRQTIDERIGQTVRWYRENGWLPEKPEPNRNTAAKRGEQNQPHGV